MVVNCGYPASVELPSRNVVTVFYTRVSPARQYEMRAAQWT